MARVPEELQTQEELLPLVMAARDGSEEAALELQRRMRPLVVSIVKRKGHGKVGYSKGRYTAEQLDDMTMTAWEGVWETVKDYDPEHEGGQTFWKVCYWRINNTVNTWMAEHSGALPLTYWAWQKAPQIDKTLEEAGIGNWEDLGPETLAEITGVKSARAILDARREAWAIDPDLDAPSTQSAEDEYMENLDLDMQRDLTNTLDAMSTLLQSGGDPDVAETLAWDYVDRHDIDTNDVSLVDMMLEQAKKDVGL